MKYPNQLPGKGEPQPWNPLGKSLSAFGYPSGHLLGALLVGPSTAQGLLLAGNSKHCRAAACLVAGSGSSRGSLHVLSSAWLVPT